MSEPQARDEPAAVPDGGLTIIGLTGPIGCGKSTVGSMLAELGGLAIDADALAREVTGLGGPATGAIRERFGDEAYDSSGALDRAGLAGVVFTDATALDDLEQIVHPYVRELVEARLGEARRAGDPFVSVEAIKLVEGGLADRCDEVWLLECDAATQRERLIGRGMDPPDLERRIAAQGVDLADRLGSRADRRIDTEGSKESLRERVEDALAEVLAPRFAGLPWGPVEGR
jgi:dephospho-CoA kinase